MSATLPPPARDSGGIEIGDASRWGAASQAMRRAALAVARPAGPTLFDDLMHELAGSLGAAVAFVAVFDNEARTRMRSLAALLDGRPLRSFDYELAGTPCAQVVGREYRYVARGVAAEFKPDTIFAAKGLDSYAAYPLNDSAGSPLGLLVAMDRKPIADSALAEALLKIFASRITAEIERSRADEALRAAALAVSSARGDSVFAELVRYLATILHVEIAFIARHDKDDPQGLRMLALSYDGEIMQDIRYPIAHTPCETVLGQQFRAYPSGLAEQFPDDDDVLAQGTCSYAGYPLADLSGAPIGIISIASRQPLTHIERIESMLQIFAVRAAAEIERLRSDEALRRSEASYRAIFESAEDAIFIHDWDTGKAVDVNPKACATYGYSHDELLQSVSVADVCSGVPPYTWDDAKRYFELAKQGCCPRFEWHRRNKDGSLHWDEVCLKPVTIGGNSYVVAFTREITERKMAEEELKLREEQYRAVFNASSDAFVLRDGGMRIVDVNPAFTKITGFTREHLDSETGYPSHFPPEYVEERRAYVRRALAGVESHYEATLLRADGSNFEAEVRVIPVRYRGEPHVLSVVRDVTERKTAERALQLREEQYRAIFDGATDAMALWSRDLCIVDVNRAFTPMYGYTREESIGSVFGVRLPDDERERRKVLFERALAGEETQIETQSVRRNGESFDVELRYSPIAYRGEPHVLSVMRDITERKQAERALQLREEQYRAMFDGVTDAMVLWSRDVRIVDVNKAFTEMYGYTREEVIGGGFGRRLTREEVELRVDMIHRALAGQESQLETVTVGRNGRRFDVELRYQPIVHRGEPHVLAVARDITERRKAEAQHAELEAQLRQAQKMEAIGQLTGGIAHDFNNILTSVIGYVVLAGERAQPLGDARLVHQLEQAHLAAQRARDLIAQMLTFARRQRGARSALALPPLVRQSVQLLRATLPSTIDLDADTPDALPAVQADAVQIEQVLFNLCINARDAIGARSGHIRVRARQLSNAGCHCASCRARVAGGRWVELSVTDSGSGIAPDVLERMFDPFYTTKDVGKGSGMGLAMVHGIVHDHGGHLCVETQPGVGSTFRVLLPLAASQPAAALPALSQAPARAPLRGRVLVVEDEAMVGDFMIELLGGWGLDVVLHRDPMQALAWATDPANSVDLVITDQTMPQLTGLELAERLRASRPQLPVVLYTGNASELEAAELQCCGVSKALRKPVDPEVLRALVRQLLSRGSADCGGGEPAGPSTGVPPDGALKPRA